MNLILTTNKSLISIATLILICIAKPFFAQSTENHNQPNILKDSRDGKRYKVMRIGNQIWMTENLAYKTPEGCWPYLDDRQYVSEHGFLYNWETAKEACPDGWELPTKADFNQLLFLIARDNKNPSKEIIQGGCSGFEAIQSGWRTENGQYVDLDYSGNYWTRSKSFRGQAWLLFIGKNGRKSYIDFADKRFGMSVRCIKK
ncbi:hypothetical protein L21SP5_01879 [Salinivirga cyanobacteriivorans]|uniref:Fibrobacter succinogenes major paralogous domain-containing protein n=1 Tax=Salinivirga cyanobacteriivorans TaxID=1307839 RepID=A0A0S2HZM6_9BACT|nr:FISUMP domain-containing protein [Salinivirga cyanobacteriivorans]ALO15519.1 hypothetical protein L21SP5_01879 [Salinivirga cyanobacteriivorans]